MRLPILIHQGKIRGPYFLFFGSLLGCRFCGRSIFRISIRSGCCTILSRRLRPVICGLRFLNLLCFASQLNLGQIAGNSVHKAGQGHNTHKNQQDCSDLDRIFDHIPLFLKEIKDRAGENTYKKEGNDKSKCINTYKKESFG